MAALRRTTPSGVPATRLPKQPPKSGVTPQLRCRMEAALTRLIDALDLLDGDPDLEASLAGYSPGHIAPDAEDDAGECAEVDDEGDDLDLGELDESDMGAAA